jgi:hypothetical protein
LSPLKGRLDICQDDRRLEQQQSFLCANAKFEIGKRQLRFSHAVIPD